MDKAEVLFGEAKMFREDDLLLTENFLKNRDDMRSRDMREDDVILVSYPKSGNSWVRRILSLIKCDGDVERAEASTLNEHVPFIEMVGFPDALPTDEPIFVFTHSHYEHLPRTLKDGKGKILYIARNPKDIIVSFYYFLKSHPAVKMKMPFEEFFEVFISGPIPFGLWVKHVMSYWKHRDDTNFLFLTYEDLHANLEEKVLEIASFVGKDLTKEQAKNITFHSRFEQVKNNPSANLEWVIKNDSLQENSSFMRKGKVGDWKNMLTEEMSRRLDEMVAAELTPIGLTFRFE